MIFSFKKGSILRVKFVRSCPEFSYLSACGFVHNAKIQILAFSLLKKTVLIGVCGSVVSIKKNLAKFVEVSE